MKKAKRIIWGIVLVALGVLAILRVTGVADIDIFFKGWWALLIIVPSAIGLFTDHDKVGSVIGILIGVVCLLCARDILDWGTVGKLIVPVLIIIAGIKLIFSKSSKGPKKLTDGEGNEVIFPEPKSWEKAADGRNVTAVLSGQDVIADGEVFEGAVLNAMFGGIKCNLRRAIIEKDCVIEVSAIFGGIEILLPDNVNVQTNTSSFLGGVTNKFKSQADGPTVYIKGSCAFGGVELK